MFPPQRADNFNTQFWIQLIFGGAVQLAHFILVPETRSTILIDREAKRRRKAGETNIYGPSELKEKRFSAKEIFTTWGRPVRIAIDIMRL